MLRAYASAKLIAMPNLDGNFLLAPGWRQALLLLAWLKENLSLEQMLIYVAVGGLLGLTLGVVAVLALRRFGLLRRQHFLWRLVTACYVLYIPAVLLIAGVQAGLCRAGHRVFNEQLERNRTDIQHFADDMLVDVKQNLQHALGDRAELSQSSLNDLVDGAVDQAIAQAAAAQPNAGARGMFNQLLLKAISAPSARAALRKRLMATIGSAGLDKKEAAALMSARLDDLTSGQFLLELLEWRLRGYLRGFYIGVAIHTSLWLLPPALEIALAYALPRRRRPVIAIGA